MSNPSASGASGGPGGMRGYSYQARVTAYVATVMLAEESASPPFLLRDPVNAIGCETRDAVDDLVVRTTESRAYVQAKRKVQMRLRPEAPLAKGLCQFIDQFNTDFDPLSDRLVLAYSEASAPIRQHLAAILERARHDPFEASLAELATTDSERQVLDQVAEFVRTNWPSSDPSDLDVRSLLASIRLQQLQLEDGQRDADFALHLLRESILVNPKDADAAWAQLMAEASDLIAAGAPATRRTFRDTLGQATIHVAAPRSYRDDIRRLESQSEGVVERLARYGRLRLGEQSIVLDRPYAEALLKAVEAGNILVVGEPGAGKSGALHELVAQAKLDGWDVIAFSALELAAASLGQLRTELGLQHDVLGTLQEWTGASPGLVVVDALDAARGSASIRTLTSLITEISRVGSRWRVVATIREFDLRMNRRVQAAFPGECPPGPAPPLAKMAVERVRHLVIGPLSDDELGQLANVAPKLHEVLEAAPPELLAVLRNPFNLDLAAELLSRDLLPEELGSIRSQRELLDRYWHARFFEDEETAQGLEMEKGLRRILKTMVTARQLQADRGELIESVSSIAYQLLCSKELIIESSGTVTTGKSVTVKHHVFFDYAVHRLLLPPEPSSLADWLGVNRDLVLFLRPSLQLQLDALWSLAADHSAFWEAAFALVSEPRLPEIGRLIAPAHAASHTTSLACVGPFMEALESDVPADRTIAAHAFRLMAGAIVSKSGGRSHPRPWAALLRWMAPRLTAETAFPFRGVLHHEIEGSPYPGSSELRDLGESARALLRFARTYEPYNASLARSGLHLTCRTFASYPTASAAVIRWSIDPRHLAKHGAEEILSLVMEVRALFELDAELVSDIYVAIFRYREVSEEPTSLGGVILSLRSTRKQDYDTSKYSLVTAFPQFLASNAKVATSTLLRLLEPYLQENRRLDVEAKPAEFAFPRSQSPAVGRRKLFVGPEFHLPETMMLDNSSTTSRHS